MPRFPNGALRRCLSGRGTPDGGRVRTRQEFAARRQVEVSRASGHCFRDRPENSGSRGGSGELQIEPRSPLRVGDPGAEGWRSTVRRGRCQAPFARRRFPNQLVSRRRYGRSSFTDMGPPRKISAAASAAGGILLPAARRRRIRSSAAPDKCPKGPSPRTGRGEKQGRAWPPVSSAPSENG